jgi:hypothetical protein
MNDDLDFEQQLKLLAKMIEPLPVFKEEYRLYYDKNSGDPLFFSMESPLGDYIIVTKEDYEQAAINYIQVVEGKLVRKKLQSELQNRYIPSATGVRTIEDDIQFVVDDDYKGPVSIWKLDD